MARRMDEDAVTIEDMDALLRFLPLFEDPGRQYIVGSGGGQPTGDGAVTVRYPIYSREVLEFYRLAGQACWSDYAYDPREASRMLADADRIERASLAELKTMLTYCVRGERFCDGLWAEMLRAGHIAALLRRLQVLRGQIGSDAVGCDAAQRAS